jgi:hypothetical protein
VIRHSGFAGTREGQASDHADPSFLVRCNAQLGFVTLSVATKTRRSSVQIWPRNQFWMTSTSVTKRPASASFAWRPSAILVAR